MFEGGNDTDRQHMSNVLRFRAKQTMKASLGWDILVVVALILGNLTFAIIFIILASFLALSSLAYESHAERLWTNPRNHEN